jgi:hypothetical protein
MLGEVASWKSKVTSSDTTLSDGFDHLLAAEGSSRRRALEVAMRGLQSRRLIAQACGVLVQGCCWRQRRVVLRMFAASHLNKPPLSLNVSRCRGVISCYAAFRTLIGSDADARRSAFQQRGVRRIRSG